MRPKPLMLLLALGVAAVPAGAQEDAMNATFTITSPAFAEGQPIPARFTADGEDVSPELLLAHAPEGTASFALIMDDPDAPRGTWVHWVVWNIPADTAKIGEDELPKEAVEGRNSWGRRTYGGPSPPSGTHRYLFKAYALDTALDLSIGAGSEALQRAIEGHVLARATLMGTYHR